MAGTGKEFVMRTFTYMSTVRAMHPTDKWALTCVIERLFPIDDSYRREHMDIALRYFAKDVGLDRHTWGAAAARAWIDANKRALNENKIMLRLYIEDMA